MAFWRAPFTLVTWPAGLPTRRCLSQPSWPMSHGLRDHVRPCLAFRAERPPQRRHRFPRP
jgi:hypothetical protein